MKGDASPKNRLRPIPLLAQPSRDHDPIPTPLPFAEVGVSRLYLQGARDALSPGEWLIVPDDDDDDEQDDNDDGKGDRRKHKHKHGKRADGRGGGGGGGGWLYLNRAPSATAAAPPADGEVVVAALSTLVRVADGAGAHAARAPPARRLRAALAKRRSIRPARAPHSGTRCHTLLCSLSLLTRPTPSAVRTATRAR